MTIPIPIIGRERETRILAERLDIAGAGAVAVGGEPGTGRASVARAAAGADRIEIRIPSRSAEVPLAAAWIWIEGLLGRRAEVDAPVRFVRKGAANAARRLARLLERERRPVLLLDAEYADALSLRSLDAALASLRDASLRVATLRVATLRGPRGAGSGSEKTRVIVTLRRCEDLPSAEPFNLGPLPFLACDEILAGLGVDSRQRMRLVVASRGRPLDLRSLGLDKKGEPIEATSGFEDRVRRLPAVERRALAAAAWGARLTGLRAALDRLGETDAHGRATEAALSSLDLVERVRLRRTLARRGHELGLGRAVHQCAISDPQCVDVLHDAADGLYERGHAAAALALLDAAVGAAPETTRWAIVRARCLEATGDWAAAEDVARDVLVGGLGPANRAATASGHDLLGVIMRRKGRIPAALAEAELAVGSARAARPAALTNRAAIRAEAGDVAGARDDLAEAMRTGRGRDRLVATVNFAYLAIRAGGRAEAALGEALRLARELEQDESEAIVLLNRSLFRLDRRRFAEAARDAETAERIARASGLREAEMRSAGNLAEALLGIGDLAGARAAGFRTLACHRRLRIGPDAAAWALLVLAEVAAKTRNRPEVRRRARASRDLASDLGLDVVARRAEALLRCHSSTSQHWR